MSSMTDQVITDSPTQTVEEQASAVTPNIQSDNQADGGQRVLDVGHMALPVSFFCPVIAHSVIARASFVLGPYEKCVL